MNNAKRRARLARMLSGGGLEIGALHLPLPVPPHTSVLYSDVLEPEEIDRRFPGSRHPDFVSDGEHFPTVANDTFDFVVANHVLEHIGNPIRALKEWHRILRPGGLLFMALPDKRYTFDYMRKRTTLRHIQDDYHNNLDPRLRNLDHLIDCATNVEGFTPYGDDWKRWIEHRFETGFSDIHHHVWVLKDALRLMLYLRTSGIAPFALVRYLNTSAFGNEFILLLRARKGAGQLQDAADFAGYLAAMGGAWGAEPVQVLKAWAKRRYKARQAARLVGKDVPPAAAAG